MLTEDYVSYEIAKLLKEKGFDEDCKAYYEDGKFCWVWNDGRSRNTDNPKYVSCPTQAHAMKWVRKIYRLHISANPYLNEEGEVTWVWEIIDIETAVVIADSLDDDFNSCEEAVDAALKYYLTEL